MKRKLIKTIRPQPGNERNRLRVEVHDFYDEKGEVIGIGYLICSKNWHGDDWWVNTHYNDLDELMRMLKEAHRVGEERMNQIKRIKRESLGSYGERLSYSKK
jgi:hypothetical protein